MPPRSQSRHRFSAGRTDRNGKLFLEERVPFRFQPFNDNRVHTVTGSARLWNIAVTELAGVSNEPGNLWWIIADFQNPPIHDPTRVIPDGTELIIPSDRVINTRIFNESRRRG